MKNSGDRAVLQLAQELFEKLNDADNNTAHVALEVAKQQTGRLRC